MNGARFLLLDEPFAGINGEAIAIVKATFGILKEEGITILMIEHNKEQLFEISDTVYKMKHGKLNRIESVDYANN
jgi:ABC-type branched-subunit amino acid transport system ATPase component